MYETQTYDEVGSRKLTTPAPVPRQRSFKQFKTQPPTSDGKLSSSAPNTPSPESYYDNSTVVTKSKYSQRIVGKPHETQSCSRFRKTGTPNLDSTLRQFEQRLAKDKDEGKGHEYVYVNTDFAGGVFDINGGYLTLPEYKITMYVPSRSVAAGLEPLFISGDRQMSNAPSLQDGEQLVSPVITCGKVELETHMEQDIVLSFPLYTGVNDGKLYDALQPMRKDIGKDNQWQILADGIDCLKVVNPRNGRCTLMVDRLGCYAIIANSPISTAVSDTTSNLCVGVFGRVYAKTDVVNIVVFFWRDSVSAKQRVLAEELHEGLFLMDQIRCLIVKPGDERIHVELTNIKPGWTVRSQQHQQTFQINTLLSNLDSSCLPSCTFSLEYTANPRLKFPVAKCTVEVYTKCQTTIVDSVQFEAVISSAEQNPFSGMKGTQLADKQRSISRNQIECKPRPPPCLTYKALREVATYLCQPSKGRHAASKVCVWKKFGEEIGLKSTDIKEVEERYGIRSPGGALLDLYFGEQLAHSRGPRDITAKLLAIFKKMGLDEITNILKRELRQFDHREKVRVVNTIQKSSCSDIGPYEDIETPINKSRSPVRRSPSTTSRTDEPQRSVTHPSLTSPKLPPRVLTNRQDRPEPPPKTGSLRLLQSPTPPRKSPKPLPRIPVAHTTHTNRYSPHDLSKDSDDESDGMNLYDAPALPPGPRRRTSFLHGDGSAAKVNSILGSGSPSRDSSFSEVGNCYTYPLPRVENRSRSLPGKPVEETLQPNPGTTTKVSNMNYLPAYREDVELVKMRLKTTPPATVEETGEENAYSDISEKERQRILGSSASAETASINERKKVFESADQAIQEMQTRLTKAAQTGGARAMAAASNARNVMTQLRGKLSSGKRSIQSPRPSVSSPKPLHPDKSPFKDTIPLPIETETTSLPTYDSVPAELIKPAAELEDPYLKPILDFQTVVPPTQPHERKIEESEPTERIDKYPPPPATKYNITPPPPANKPIMMIEEPEPTYDSPVSWQRPDNSRYKTKNEYSEPPC